MRRLLRAASRIPARADLGLLCVGTLCAVGLGLHATDDWHHHGEMGAGFFHLHFHVGDHGHPDLDDPEIVHVHIDHADHGHAAGNRGTIDSGVPHCDEGIPGNSHPAPAESDRRRHAVLTVPSAVKNLSQSPPTLEVQTASPEPTTTSAELPVRTFWRSRTADPRGPPA